MPDAATAALFHLDKAPPGALALSVVVPVYNEAENVTELAGEIATALKATADFEIILVDDGSTDETGSALAAVREADPRVRVLRHARNAGQSRALRTGILAARGAVIVTLDGDGQNDPADIPAVYVRLTDDDTPDAVAMVIGRRAKRQDTWRKRAASRIANGVRKRLLRDGADDTGCGLKAFYRAAYLRLPYFDHAHRYLPALMIREGFEIAQIDVNHRPRLHGRSKYTNIQRLAVAFRDILGVAWLNARARGPGEITEAE